MLILILYYITLYNIILYYKLTKYSEQGFILGVRAYYCMFL